MKKRVLLIGIGFANYEIVIKQELEKTGYTVDLLYEKYSSFSVCSRIVSNSVNAALLKDYHNKMINQLRNREYDLIVVIVGLYLTKDFLNKLKQQQRNAKFILYLWDQVAIVDNFYTNLKLYDEIISFDPSDCKKFNLRFLPLFYMRECNNNQVKDMELYCAMSEHSGRVAFAEKIAENCPLKQVNIIINQGRIKFVKNILRHKTDSITYRAKPIDKIADINNTKNSKIVLDVNFPSQRGLGIRIIEALACGCNIITTNQDVKYYRFYDSERIQIVDFENPQVDWEKIKNCKNEVSHEIEKYSIASWVEVLLGEQKFQYLKDNNPYGKGF